MYLELQTTRDLREECSLKVIQSLFIPLHMLLLSLIPNSPSQSTTKVRCGGFDLLEAHPAPPLKPCQVLVQSDGLNSH